MNLIPALKVLANDKRFKILQWLKEPRRHFTSAEFDVEEEGVYVGLIEKKIRLLQSTVSQYLLQLQNAGLISMERRGQWTFCKYNPTFVDGFIRALGQQL
jgi:DNA-binding transcriptional ArsR family regulator